MNNTKLLKLKYLLLNLKINHHQIIYNKVLMLLNRLYTNVGIVNVPLPLPL